jgi:hypothetical protein
MRYLVGGQPLFTDPVAAPVEIILLLTYDPLRPHRYHDGMMAMDRDKPLITMKRFFYPKWYLQATGYFNHPGTFGENVILFQPTPGTAEVPVSPVALTSDAGYYGGLLLTAALSSVASVMAVLYVLQRQEKLVALLPGQAPYVARHEYTPINSNAEL